MVMYDYLIVGSGLFGSVFAHELTKSGKKCLVIEQRSHVGGNVYCENIQGINVHKYGAHIFHTSDETIWNYVNRFVKFNNFINSPLAYSEGKLYNLPFNMNTFYALWGVKSPEEALKKISEQTSNYSGLAPSNLEEYALKSVGVDIYYKFIKHYTEKQWNDSAQNLPSSIIKRIPLRYNFDNNYFQDRYQGIPIGGYNILIEKLLDGIEVRSNTDFFLDQNYYRSIANKTVFTGRIDQFFNYKYGTLDYRSLKFEHEIHEVPNYQGNAVINFTDADIPYTRRIEHKHFEFGTTPYTVVSKEFSIATNKSAEPYYPVQTDQNMLIYAKYAEMAKSLDNVLFGGRLAEFKYFDMHQAIGSALKKSKAEIALNKSRDFA
jgi:UDP-galactopyranose mutase